MSVALPMRYTVNPLFWIAARSDSVNVGFGLLFVHNGIIAVIGIFVKWPLESSRIFLRCTRPQNGRTHTAFRMVGVG